MTYTAAEYRKEAECQDRYGLLTVAAMLRAAADAMEKQQGAPQPAVCGFTNEELDARAEAAKE